MGSYPILVVLAAGESRRFDGGPKQLQPVGPEGETLIDYAIRDAVKAGFKRIVFVIQREIEKDFRDSVGQRSEAMVDICYAYGDQIAAEGKVIREKPWGTGYSLLSASKYIDGPFGVINADDYYGVGSYKLLKEYLASDDKANRIAMVGYLLKNTMSRHGGVTRGICTCNSKGELIDIHETMGIYMDRESGEITQEDSGTRFSGETLVSMNMWGMDKGFLELLKQDFEDFVNGYPEPDDEFLLPDTVARLLRTGKIAVDVLPTDEKWFGITYREDVDDVARTIKDLNL